MSDEGWEARMADRAKARERERRGLTVADGRVTDPRLEAFIASRPDIAPEAAEAIRRMVEVDGWDPPYNPADYRWTADEVRATSPDLCWECYEPRPYPEGQGCFGWAAWLTCATGYDNRMCDHAHHLDELWVG